MKEKMCFLFGNSSAPETCKAALKAAIEELILTHHIHTFVVGEYGNFDRFAISALRQMKTTYPHIQLLLLIPYHPFIREYEVPPGFDRTYYPYGMENVPPRFAIPRANEQMIQNCSSIICYVKYVGNSRNLLEKAVRKPPPLGINNIADSNDR